MKSEDRLEMKDLIPNPILIKNKNNIEVVTERILHNLILENIENFMKELGNAFSFIGSEYKIKIGKKKAKTYLTLFLNFIISLILTNTNDYVAIYGLFRGRFFFN